MAEKYRKMISYSAICSDASQPGAKAPWQVRDVQDTASAGSHEAPGAFGTPERILTAGLPLRSRNVSFPSETILATNR